MLRAVLCSMGVALGLAGCVSTGCGYGGCDGPGYGYGYGLRRGADYYRAPRAQPAPRMPVAPALSPLRVAPYVAPRVEHWRPAPAPGGGARGFVPHAAPSAAPGRGNRRR